MINKRSNYLVILIATCNRLELMKKVLDSIHSSTKCSHEIIVIDGGSKDGTVEYLKNNKKVTPVFQGKLLGTAKAYNQVWRKVSSKYTCWLSDDTEVIKGSLDTAVSILESDSDIGMVGLKMKDVLGPWTKEPYLGGISQFGIITCNHGVLSMDMLKKIEYFNEGYHSYTIDKDLTASILCTGRKAVMTKRISLLHYREWSNNLSQKEFKNITRRSMKGINNEKIYHNKFKFLNTAVKSKSKATLFLRTCLAKIFLTEGDPDINELGLNLRDWHNVIESRFVQIFDPVVNIGKPYHLVQKIPYSILMQEGNPYKSV